MVFHEGFIIKPTDLLRSPNWFAKRAELYKRVAMWKNRPFDEVCFDFSAPDCSWIVVSIYVNGKMAYKFPLTAVFDSFHEIKLWLEDIVTDTKLSSELYLEIEERTVILHYEHICLANVGVERKFVNEDRHKAEWEFFDANNGEPDTGLFYFYDSDSEDIPVVCYCLTKQFLFALYNRMMHYSSRNELAALIGKEWLYLEHGNRGNLNKANWTLYNIVKSSLVEWNYDSKKAYRHRIPQFKQAPFIRETVHMWAEWGDGLFWHQQGGCCGNAERFFVDTNNTRIDLRDIPAVRTWYDEFDTRRPEEEWADEAFTAWFEKGWELAKQIRQRLPMEVDLFYHWKSFALDDNTLRIDIPYIVPDSRLLVERSSEH